MTWAEAFPILLADGIIIGVSIGVLVSTWRRRGRAS